MANITDVKGTITINEDLYQNTDKFKVIYDFFSDTTKKHNLIGEYGIMLEPLDNFTQCSPVFKFFGSGRNALAYNLPDLFIPLNLDTDSQSKQLFNNFYQTLQTSTEPDIKIEYDEYEQGNEILNHVGYQMWTDPTNPKHFGHDLTDFYDYKYNDKAKIDLEFEEGYLINNPTQKKQFIQKEIQPWYDQKDADFKQSHPFNQFTKKLCNAIMENSEFEAGICYWRTEDNDECETTFTDLLA